LHFEFPNAIVNSLMLKPKSCYKMTNEVDNAECTGTQITKISEVGE